MPIKVFFHSYENNVYCMDGFTAAYVCWTVLGDTAEYIPCVHQSSVPEIEAGDTIYIVDFSFSRDVLVEWKSKANVIVLDHHKTAQRELEGLSFAFFDMNQSGAEMAWNFFYSGEPCPALISYVADRDLWKKELPFTEEIHRSLSTFPKEFLLWDVLANMKDGDYVTMMRKIGEPIYQKYLADLEELASTATWRDLKVPTENCDVVYKTLCVKTDKVHLISEVLNLLCQRNPTIPFAFNYFVSPDGIKYSLRSIGDFDVSAIAKSLGGGGHKNAAGCFVPHSF